MKSLLSSMSLNQVEPLVSPLDYDHASATAGIVHIGIGAFHRAHQAVFTNDLLSIEPRWKITAVSLRSPNVRDNMATQDYFYTVVERANDSDNVKLIGAIDKVLVAPEDPNAVISAISDSSTKVITLTITEKGYCRDGSNKHLDVENPAIAHDLKCPELPKSFAGFIVAACKIRQKNNQPLTVISCDNLPSNGRITQTIVLEFAQQLDPVLTTWIKENVSFCNSMVDRIVPATTTEDVAFVEELIGVEDQSTVITEPFKQWIIEDNFVNEKPSWDKVGVLYVADVEPFEDMKLRLLNGAHSCLAYVGFLLGYEYIHQAVKDANCLALTKRLHKDLLSTVKQVPGIDLNSYTKQILTRFANDKVPYKTSQVASDGSQKLPQRLLKPAEEIANAGKVSQPIAFVIACWCKFVLGKDSEGKPFKLVDPLADLLSKLANQHQENESQHVIYLLNASNICSEALFQHQAFVNQIIINLKEINKQGVAGALKDLVVKERI